MSWVRLKNPFENTDVIDVDYVNDNILRFVHEGSYLNEHNWDRDGDAAANHNLLDTLNMDDKVAYTVAIRPYVKVNGGETTGTDPHGGSGMDLPTTAGWSAVDTTNARKTIVTRGGMFLIIASFQLRVPGGGHTFQFCIGTDDSPRMESVIGSADGNNPDPTPGWRYPTGDLTTSPIDVETAYAAFKGVGPFHAGGQRPLQASLATWLPPGQHDIDLMSRHIHRGTSVAGVTDKYITNCALIVLDLWANPE